MRKASLHWIAAIIVVGAAAVAVAPAWASSGGGRGCKESAPWEEWHAGVGVGSAASLQRGARNFVNYCLGCHSLQYVRYSRIAKDLGIPDDLAQKNLMFTGERIHDYVLSAMPAQDGETWFGRAPPDLSLITRARGADYVYQFLKGFYIDEGRPTGANNLVLKDTAMPYVLADVSGPQRAVFVLEKCVEGGEEKMVRHFDRFEAAGNGQLGAEEFDVFVRDIVNFLQYVGEPVQAQRQSLGIWVIAFLVVFTLFAWGLKKEIWKDVH